ncbi:MAG TPA: two-component regulator propeller domain-containing protein [Dokdonella sp.]|uniref:hybrid sensor histidine kinase/response regulator n=1 Tax=Dokdonella sp. TaxID=2291710 RepID=UPI002C4EB8F8|nr:two-component regulator propeller domain-containing protein [Dokdonella sp.]HUD40614.1 two-component regulator propeller domain-containing protein [Dokdonella sp.]
MPFMFARWLTMFVPLLAAAAPPPAEPRFEVLGVADGLPSSRVYALAQDADGFIWIGTADGLARYDGVEVRVWRHDPRDAGSLAGNDVASLLVDRHGRVWSGGEASGISRLDPGARGFVRYRHVPSDRTTIGSNDIFAIAEDAAGTIWVGTYGGGLARYERDGSFTQFRHDADDPDGLRSDAVISLYGDPAGRLWIGTDHGLDVRDLDGRIHHVDLPGLDARAGVAQVSAIIGEPDGGALLTTPRGLFAVGADLSVTRRLPIDGFTPLSAARDRSGRLWIGTVSGLGVFDGDQADHFLTHEQIPGTLPGARIMDVLCDHEGSVWLATQEGGVARLPPTWRNFSNYRFLPGSPASLTHGTVNALAVGPDDAVWALSAHDGLDRIDPASGHVERHGHRLDGNRQRMAALLVQDEAIWIGQRNGLRRIDRAGRTRAYDFPVDADRDDALPPGLVSALAAGDDRIWAVVLGQGVVAIDPRTHALRRYRRENDRLTSADIKVLARAPDGGIWIATTVGVERYVPAEDRFRRVTGVPFDLIDAFAFAPDGTFWAHHPGRLERYRMDGDIARRIDQVERDLALPTMPGAALVIADDGSPWLASRRGLWHFDPAARRLNRYGEGDGLPSVEFRNGAAARTSDGTIWMSTLSGLVAFDPRALRIELARPPVRVTALTVRRDGRMVDLPPSGPVVLGYDDRDLQVDVRALSYVNPAANRYRFQLAHFDEGWIDTGDRGQRVFSQLPAGRYPLRISATNGGGEWSDLDPPLLLEVAPPAWATEQAYLVYFAALLGIGWIVMRGYRERIKRQHALQLAEERRRAAELVADAKSRFLAMMSHEIRTPLTGVLGMTDLLLRTPLETRQRSQADAIRKSGEVLLRIVNDSLDLARIEAGKLSLDPVAFDPGALLHEVAAVEEGIAAAKGVGLVVDIAPGVPARVVGDAVRIKQILLNLVGNALKFTEQGQVHLGLTIGYGGIVRFRIEDSGPGMSADMLERLFSRFEQSDGVSRRHGGSGLGLAICQELTQLMHGRIHATSVPGHGSVFTVELPLLDPRIPPPDSAEAALAREAAAAAPAVEAPRTAPLPALTILLVEDDLTVAAVASGLLEAAGHRVVHAAQALAALVELSRGRFDLAIVDLDLPGIDGLQLTAMIRKQAAHAGLPVLAVTARSGGEEEAAAKAAGMDGFLRKPLTESRLQEAIERLLQAVAPAA